MDSVKDTAQEDTRSQPWKDWVQDELDARKKADTTEAGRKKQENLAKAFIRKNDDDDEEAYDTNKSG
jgi:hypothetical protein